MRLRRLAKTFVGGGSRAAKRFMTGRGRLAKTLLLACGAGLLLFASVAASIYAYGGRTSEGEADAAIVLGAAVWTRRPSPVFEERINHAVELYKSGRVRKLILTGGRGAADEPAESAAARTYAVRRGVRPADILTENKSHTTYENLQQARGIVAERGYGRVLVVTDPLHMKRAVTMARDVGLDAHPSPTPTTRYQSARSQLTLLFQETYTYIGYRLGRLFFG